MWRITHMGIRIMPVLLAVLFLVNPVGAEMSPDVAVFQERAEDVLLWGLEKMEKIIDLSSYRLTPGEITGIYRRLMEDHPGLYHVEFTFTYTYDQDGYLVELFPAYRMDQAALAASRRQVLTWLREVQAQGERHLSEGDKILFIHDYLAEQYTYSPTGEENYDIYSMITQGHGVCQAFSLALIALGRCLGLEADMVTSTAMDHAWNHVTVDGAVYHVDVTRDLGDEAHGIGHERFLLCDEAMAALGYHDYDCHESHSCDTHNYEIIAEETVHQSILKDVEGLSLYLSSLWLGQTTEQDLVRWSLQKGKEAYHQGQPDLDGDGILSLSDILLPEIQEATGRQMKLADELRRRLLLKALGEAS